MADEADRTQQDIEFLQEIATHVTLKREAEATGYCLFCGEKIIDDPKRRWCSFECMDMWEKENKKR